MARVGRPPKGPYRGKSTVFSTRITPELRSQLEQAAFASQRSLSQEVEHRLFRSFLDEAAHTNELGGPHNYAFMRLLGAAVAALEAARGIRWFQDHKLRSEVEELIKNILPHYMDLAAGNAGDPRSRSIDENVMGLAGELAAAVATGTSIEAAVTTAKSMIEKAEGKLRGPQGSDQTKKDRRAKGTLERPQRKLKIGKLPS